jgi:hypothetical protein
MQSARKYHSLSVIANRLFACQSIKCECLISFRTKKQADRQKCSAEKLFKTEAKIFQHAELKFFVYKQSWPIFRRATLMSLVETVVAGIRFPPAMKSQ